MGGFIVAGDTNLGCAGFLMNRAVGKKKLLSDGSKVVELLTAVQFEANWAGKEQRERTTGSEPRIKCCFGAPGPAESLSGRMTCWINERLAKINHVQKCFLDKKKKL